MMTFISKDVKHKINSMMQFQTLLLNIWLKFLKKLVEIMHHLVTMEQKMLQM